MMFAARMARRISLRASVVVLPIFSDCADARTLQPHSNSGRTAAARVSQRNISHGRSSQRPGGLLGRAARAGDHSARRAPHVESLRKVLRQDRFRHLRPPPSTASSANAPSRAKKPCRKLDQPPDRGELQCAALAGHAHSIECWRDGELVGGLYGVGFDRVFCGESMFSRRRCQQGGARLAGRGDARGGLCCCSTRQFMTEHLARMGAVALPQARYIDLLAAGQGRLSVSIPTAVSKPRRRLFARESHRAILDPDIVDRVFDHVQAGRVLEQPARKDRARTGPRCRVP